MHRIVLVIGQSKATVIQRRTQQTDVCVAKPLPVPITMRPGTKQQQDGVIEPSYWPTSIDWERHKQTIINLYKGGQMKSLITEMKARHNFKATYVSTSFSPKESHTCN